MRRVAIIGAGLTPYKTKRLDVDTPSLVFEAVGRALADADMTIQQVDAVVFGLAPEGFEGVNQAEKWCAGATGAIGKPFLRIHTGGATGGSAAQAGVYHVASGMFDVVAVVGLQRVGESPTAQNILNTIWDPIWEKDFALNTISMSALLAMQSMQKYGVTKEHIAQVAVNSRYHASLNPWAHLRERVTVEQVLNSPYQYYPLHRYECCPRSDGACVIIVASEEKAKQLSPRPAWVKGLSGCSDVYFIGDRTGDKEWDYCNLQSLAIASNDAYKQAGIEDPRHEIDVAEIYAPFANMEIAMLEAVGFCGRGEGARLIEDGVTRLGGDLPVNPSGGVLATNPIGATALVRVAEAARQVMGKCEDYQVPDTHVALATGTGGSYQFFTSMVLSDKP